MVVKTAKLEHYSRTGLRVALVIVFIIFGFQKFTAVEAKGIVPLVSHSPLTSWMMYLGVRNMSRVFGATELSIGCLLAFGLWREGSRLAVAGAIGSCFTFLTTLSFLFTTPGLFAPHDAPVLDANGLFLVKDIVFFATSVLLLSQSLLARSRR